MEYALASLGLQGMWATQDDMHREVTLLLTQICKTIAFRKNTTMLYIFHVVHNFIISCNFMFIISSKPH